MQDNYVDDPTDDLTKSLPNEEEISERFRHSRSTWGVSILLALRDRNIYEGTVSFAEVQKRRAKNRVARKSRRTNRGAK